MDVTHWTNILTAASTGSLKCGTLAFPSGGLAFEKHIKDESIGDVITWVYRPDIGLPENPVTIGVSQHSSLAAAIKSFDAQVRAPEDPSRYQLDLPEPEQLKEWPRGFPNQNDYEGMERCVLFEGTLHVPEGTLRAGEIAVPQVFVLWVQRGASAMKAGGGEGEGECGECYIVRLCGVTAKELKDYADGIWGAVYEGSGGGT